MHMSLYTIPKTNLNNNLVNSLQNMNNFGVYNAPKNHLYKTIYLPAINIPLARI